MDVVKSKVWDVIVIGGGPSGSTVARKLALAKKKRTTFRCIDFSTCETMCGLGYKTGIV